MPKKPTHHCIQKGRFFRYFGNLGSVSAPRARESTLDLDLLRSIIGPAGQNRLTITSKRVDFFDISVTLALFRLPVLGPAVSIWTFLGPLSDQQFQYWTFPADRARKSSPDLDLLRSNIRPARQTMPDGQVQYSTCPG